VPEIRVSRTEIQDNDASGVMLKGCLKILDNRLHDRPSKWVVQEHDERLNRELIETSVDTRELDLGTAFLPSTPPRDVLFCNPIQLLRKFDSHDLFKRQSRCEEYCLSFSRSQVDEDGLVEVHSQSAEHLSEVG